MAEPTTNGTAANHELLISVAAKVDALGAALEKSIVHSSSEFDKLWKHVDERDERLTNAIASIGERVSNFGKPNVSAIVSVCVLIGSIALAFIAPIKADIERQSKGAESLAAAVLLKEEKITALGKADSEFREKLESLAAKAEDVAVNGSGITRERLAVIENDLKWMRGEKRTHPAEIAP